MLKTPAQLQIETLRRLKEARLEADKGGAPGARPAGAKVSRAKSAPRAAHALPVGPETWRRLQARGKATREFKDRLQQGEWAAQLLLALPPGAHILPPAVKEDFFEMMRQYCLKHGSTNADRVPEI